MNNSSERPSINMSAIPVAGIGGLGMLALVVIMAVAFPAARWLLFGGLVAGALLALVLLFVRRNRRLGAPRSDLPTSLFSADNGVADATSEAVEDRTVAPDERRLARVEKRAHRWPFALSPCTLGRCVPRQDNAWLLRVRSTGGSRSHGASA
jgi:hypothetical protein